MLWAACELHVPPWQYADLPVGHRELLRLMYGAVKNGTETRGNLFGA